MNAPTPQGAAAVDGRSARRDRNRSAVIDAVLSLFDDGQLAPSVDAIALRAGTSVRSVFRYFDDVDDLLQEAVARQQARLEPLWELDIDAGLPLADRIERFVAARARLLDGMGNVGRVARIRASSQPVVAAEVARVRKELRRQVASTFASELAALGDDGPAVLAAADVATSWEALDLLRSDQGLDDAAVRRVMSTALERLLGGAA